MIDFDVIPYAMLGLSLSVSAAQIGRWIQHTNPRGIIHAGRLSLLAPTVLTRELTMAEFGKRLACVIKADGTIAWEYMIDKMRIQRR